MGPLYGRSEYSLLQSLLRLNDYVLMCKEYGYTYATISDHNVLFGVKTFNNLCQQNNIKPLFSIEFDCQYHGKIITFQAIAIDNMGYIQLINLSSQVTSEPVTIDYLKNLDHCVLILFIDNGVFESCIDEEINQQNQQEFNTTYQNILSYHPNNNYLALCYQQSRYWTVRNNVAYQYANGIGLKCVAINRTYYLTQQMAYAYQVATAIGLDKTISDTTLVMDSDRYLLTSDEYLKYYNRQLINNNDEIANSCHVDLDQITTSLPLYPLNNGISSYQYLSNLALAGLKKRLKSESIPTVYAKRLKHELEIIHSMNFDDYFLIVFDYIRYAKKNNILVGPGRGSAAGSLVCYSIGITEVDPIVHQLLFERFLNPARASMPDIDTDFPDVDRDKVIEYVANKYGQQHVGHIITFNTLAAKQVLRDVAKVLEFNNVTIESICKCVPNANKITLNQALQQSSTLKQMVYENEKVKQLFQVALQLEGLPRHSSIHAAGVVFSAKPFNQCVPTIQLDNEMITIQYTMEHLQDMGLIKMDFLGLKNLTLLNEIVQLIHVDNPSFNLQSIPLNDVQTFQLICQANTIGIFQLESEGMKNLIKKLQPSCFEDIVAAIALFRPGPMENIPLYLANKANQKNIVYENQQIKDILSSTYGVAIYQEQVMQLSQCIANFSLAKADILRKAMSKKKASEIEALKNEFIDGATHNGYTLAKATSWYATIEKFSGYGFNKAHSVAYGLICYQLAYLKTHYPLLFYTAYLNSIIGQSGKMNSAISEVTYYGYKVLPPSLNFSEREFKIEDGAIRYPLTGIKNIGTVVAQSIIDDRHQNGLYLDYCIAIARLTCIKVSTSNINLLIDAGALDYLKYNRETMKANLEKVSRYGDLICIINDDGSYKLDTNLVSSPTIETVKENTWIKATNEYNALSLFLTYNPYANMRASLNINHQNLLANVMQLNGYYDCFGQIVKLKQHRTKKGDLMAFVVLMDESGSFDASIMPNTYGPLMNILKVGQYVKVSLKVGNNKGAIVNKCEVCSFK